MLLKWLRAQAYLDVMILLNLFKLLIYFDGDVAQN